MDDTCARGCCPSQADHYRSVVVRPLASPASQREKALSADLDAYRRLRKHGVQPKTYTGAAHLEREASSSFEVESGHIIRNDRLRTEMESAHTNLPPNVA